MNNHIIITIFAYPPGERFNNRMKLYKKWHLDSLYKQTLQNFDIGAICHPENDKHFEEMGIIPIHTKDGYDGHIHPTRGHWEYYTPWENITGIKKYEMQTGLDTDNFLEPEYVERLYQELERLPKDEPAHIHFQPRIKNIITGQEKEMASRYGPTWGSAMFSLYQPKEPYYFIYHDSHSRMQNLFKKSVLVNGYCLVGVHDENVINDMAI
jgi:hypothetical protein